MELFLLCSEDAESDVRMVADECLNKVIKVRTYILYYLILPLLDVPLVACLLLTISLNVRG